MSVVAEVASIRMQRCAACGRVEVASRTVCSGCLSGKLEPFDVRGVGALVSWTTIRRAPAKFRDDAPYDIAIVDLDNGHRVTGRLAAGQTGMSIGARVRAVRAEGADIVFALGAA